MLMANRISSLVTSVSGTDSNDSESKIGVMVSGCASATLTVGPVLGAGAEAGAIRIVSGRDVGATVGSMFGTEARVWVTTGPAITWEKRGPTSLTGAASESWE